MIFDSLLKLKLVWETIKQNWKVNHKCKKTRRKKTFLSWVQIFFWLELPALDLENAVDYLSESVFLLAFKVYVILLK